MIQEALRGRVEAANFIGKYTESQEPTPISPVDTDENPLTCAVFTMKKETLESWNKRN